MHFLPILHCVPSEKLIERRDDAKCDAYTENQCLQNWSRLFAIFLFEKKRVATEFSQHFFFAARF